VSSLFAFLLLGELIARPAAAIDAYIVWINASLARQPGRASGPDLARHAALKLIRGKMCDETLL
jgi:hypothetical protein